jgi:hypothetical protein
MYDIKNQLNIGFGWLVVTPKIFKQSQMNKVERKRGRTACETHSYTVETLRIPEKSQ